MAVAGDQRSQNATIVVPTRWCRWRGVAWQRVLAAARREGKVTHWQIWPSPPTPAQRDPVPRAALLRSIVDDRLLIDAFVVCILLIAYQLIVTLLKMEKFWSRCTIRGWHPAGGAAPHLGAVLPGGGSNGTERLAD